MPVVNYTDVLYLGLSGPEKRSSILESVIHSLEDNYWYVEVFNGNCLIYLEDILTTELLCDIRSGKVILCICNAFEGFHDLVEPIYQFIIKHNIPTQYVALATDASNIGETIAEVASKYNTDKIRAIWTRIAERYMSTTYHCPPKTLCLTHYDKKFINLNRRRRPHRAMLVALLDILGLRDKGYISLGVSDANNGWEKAWDNIETYIKDKTMLELFNTNKDRVFNIPDLYLDKDDLTVNYFENEPSTDEYYINSYFSLVSETIFFKESPIRDPFGISEKTFKAILNKHPFIIVGMANSLSLLRSLGYKTFGSIIDERYDSEEADDIRLMMIAKEVKRLCALDERQLKDFLNKARDIVEHNYIVLRKKRKIDCVTLLGNDHDF